jgi:hypothetical protein
MTNRIKFDVNDKVHLKGLPKEIRFITQDSGEGDFVCVERREGDKTEGRAICGGCVPKNMLVLIKKAILCDDCASSCRGDECEFEPSKDQKLKIAKTEGFHSLGDLRVWWIPQVPGTPFYVNVNNEKEAQLILDTLAEYDKFQFQHKIKPNYTNAGGLERYEPGEDGDRSEWVTWYEEGTGLDFDDYCENLK